MWRIFLTVSLLCWSADGQVTCRDNNNRTVDWYIIYKAPRLDNIVPEGLDYLYIDSAGKKETSKDHNKLINATDGVLANTLKPLFTTSMPDNFGFITYNDQPPPGYQANHTFGHSKGLVMMDKDKTGVWLLHSTPKFPFERDQNNFYPSSGAKNAQTFICVTFNYDQFQHIAPTPAGKTPHDDNIFVGDLYLTIAETYKTDVRVQTWPQRGRNGSYCEDNQRRVINIESVKTDLGNGEVEWTMEIDHSKWCVSTDNNNHLICIADMNRAITQYERPGGGLCFEHKEGRLVRDSDCDVDSNPGGVLRSWLPQIPGLSTIQSLCYYIMST